MTDRLLTKPEARKDLRIGSRKLDELIRHGDIEIIRLGGRTVRIAESALRDLINRRTERRAS